MSTRGSLYWLGDILHIFHDCLDDHVYVELFDKVLVKLPLWLSKRIMK